MCCRKMMLELVMALMVMAAQLQRQGFQVHCLVQGESASGSGLPVNGSGAGSGAGSKIGVELLVMLPLSSSSSSSGLQHHAPAEWDRGWAILPAAELAVEEINADPSLLPDCTLKLSVVDIEACVADQFATNIHALVPFANISAQPERNVLGIVGGPFCPQLLVSLVSPLASTRSSRLFQMFGSTSPIAHKENSTTTAHFLTPSTQLYYETVREMMGVFNWTRLLIIAETFFGGATNTFASQGLNVTFRQFFSSSSLSSLFQDIRRFEKNVIFVSVAPEDAAAILCQAEKEALVHPNYVWIFHDLTPELIVLSTNACSYQALERSLNGAFFLEFPLEPFVEGTRLVSGHTYTKYFADYTSRLPNNVRPSPYANVLYDSVWAFASTLDYSLATENHSLEGYLSSYGKQSLLDLMDDSLPSISFEGASGSIDFSKDPANDGVKIYRHFDGSTSLVGTYHNSSNISILEVVAAVPNDTLSSEYVLVPVPLTAILAALMVVCLILTTVVLALFIYYREDPDVKATSLYLSYLMFLGCYLLFFATLFHAIGGAIVIEGLGKLIGCWAVIGMDSLGVNLIFTTLLLRMLRVYRVFSSFHKTGKLWSNKNMACIVGVVVLLEVTFILVWSLVDTFRLVDLTTYQSTANPPYYEVKQFCQSNYLGLWLGILLGKVGLLFIIVLFLAIKTRKIKRANFKDTKKVNGYIFSTVMVVITMMALYFLFRSTRNFIASHLMVYLAFGITGFLCQLFLFIPKVTSPLLKKYGYEISYDSKKRRKTLTKKQAQTRMSRTALVAASQYTQVL